MTIEELERKLGAFIKVGIDISGLFEEFKNTNKITPRFQWTKVHDIYATKIRESTICVGTFATLNKYCLQITGVYIDALDDITQEEYETPQACMDAIEKALS